MEVKLSYIGPEEFIKLRCNITFNRIVRIDFKINNTTATARPGYIVPYAINSI